MQGRVPRRDVLLGAGWAALAGSSLVSSAPALALPRQTLRFPRDHGAHPDFRTEWWYITGHATVGGRTFGFQVTFFRSKVEATQAMSSAFAAKQLVFAHAAVTDVQGKKLWHDQRIARAGFDVVKAAEDDTRLQLRDWSLQREGSGYRAQIVSADFSFDLYFDPTQALVLQGDKGLSRKGPEEKQASYYYSQPQLATQGTLTLKGERLSVQGKAWLDHEWSNELLHPDAVGWDWIGMNYFDGSVLTAFQLRRKDGRPLWDGGSFRPSKGGGLYVASKGENEFSPQRFWKSPLSQASYPVEWIVRTPADFYTVKAVLDNQELDSRNSTGAIYWEGLSDMFDSNGKHVARGYLEMTGYGSPLRL